MKKILVFIVILLAGCSSNEASNGSKVYIDLEEVDTVIKDSELYIAVDSLADLDINILKDTNSNNVYLSKGDIPQSMSNERPYNWYIDQGDTGTYSGNNCGPSASVMAGLWQDEDFEYTPQEARGEFRSSGGWWFTDDIKDFFKKHNVSYEVDDFDGSHELIETLQEGNIILLCIDTSYIEDKDDTDSYFGKFYNYDGGHFLIVKGYTYIEGILYFEVYDSNCWGETYSDGSPKGKGRLYAFDDLEEAIEVWWDNYFIINNIN
jgi:hypothetical protein